jgi:prefoldin subunit 5
VVPTIDDTGNPDDQYSAERRLILHELNRLNENVAALQAQMQTIQLSAIDIRTRLSICTAAVSLIVSAATALVFQMTQ